MLKLHPAAVGRRKPQVSGTRAQNAVMFVQTAACQFQNFGTSPSYQPRGKHAYIYMNYKQPSGIIR
jgi:hypothetical protein